MQKINKKLIEPVNEPWRVAVSRYGRMLNFSCCEGWLCGSFSHDDNIVGEESAAGLGPGTQDAFGEHIPSGLDEGHGVTNTVGGDGGHEEGYGVGDDGGHDEGHGVGDDGGQLANMFCWNLPLGHHHHLSAPLKQSNATRVSSLIEQYGNKELSNIVHFCKYFSWSHFFNFATKVLRFFHYARFTVLVGSKLGAPHGSARIVLLYEKVVLKVEHTL